MGERAYEQELPAVMNGLTHKDWLFDGMPVRGRIMIERFARLDWSKACVDLGPSLAGNLGPYWHVPLREVIIDGELYDMGDTTHRLYPKVMATKWSWLIWRACTEVRRQTEAKRRRRAKTGARP